MIIKSMPAGAIHELGGYWIKNYGTLAYYIMNL